MRRITIIATLGLLFAIPARSQDGARLVSRGIDVWIAGEAANASTGIEPGSIVETGPTSFAVVALADGSRITLAGDTAVAVEFEGTVPVVMMSGGSVRIQAKMPVRIATPSGILLVEDTPAEVEFLLVGVMTEVRVYSGAVTASDADPGALVFRGTDDRSGRVFRAGRIDRGSSPQDIPIPWRPSIYIPYPYFDIEEPEPTPEEPEPLAPGNRPGRGPGPPHSLARLETPRPASLGPASASASLRLCGQIPPTKSRFPHSRQPVPVHQRCPPTWRTLPDPRVQLPAG